MDIMIPFLGRITRLQLESKGAFHIAGVKDANVQRIELEKRQKREIERRKKAAEKAEKQIKLNEILYYKKLLIEKKIKL